MFRHEIASVCIGSGCLYIEFLMPTHLWYMLFFFFFKYAVSFVRLKFVLQLLTEYVCVCVLVPGL